MFFGYLAGNKTYTKALAVQKDYAASLDKTAKFDIFMMRLDRAFCDITDIMEMYDVDVEVEAEPEASWN